MKIRVEVCTQCFILGVVNSKGICQSCTFRNNHDGKNQFEVYNDRAKINQSIKVNNIPNSKTNPIKTPKKRVKQDFEKLQRRQEIIDQDEELYKYIFDTTPDKCEECGTQLPDQFRDDEGKVVCRWQYSHILGKGAFPEFRHHKRNINRLCFSCHQKWEFSDRTKMNIYERNQTTIQQLYDEKNKVEI